MTTERNYDLNGWYEIKDNPLSKVGVYEYLGSTINAPEPDRIYRVYRSESELSDAECIQSFQLLPWVTEHTMLGEGETPAETKGVEGVVGQDVWFDPDDQMLKGNIKVFSNHLTRLIDTGINELSLGYRCEYDYDQSGIFNGELYDTIQHSIRGNHLATVEEGRMGPDVSVLDHANITFDSRDFIMTTKKQVKTKAVKTKAVKTVSATGQDMEEEKSMDMEMGNEPTMAEVMSMMEKVMPMLHKMESMMNGGGEMMAEEEMMDAGANCETENMDMEEEESMDMEEEKSMDMEMEEKKKSSGMDTQALIRSMNSIKREIRDLKKQQSDGMDSKTILKSIVNRDQLAGRISEHTGTFDHAAMTAEEVAAYGVQKLNIPATEGREIEAVECWLHGRQPARTLIHQSFGTDSANTNPVNDLFKRA